MSSPAATPLQVDTRAAQAERVADWLDIHPQSTGKEIDAACDAGSVTKLLSEMPGLGYGIAKGWRYEPCAAGSRRRSRPGSGLGQAEGSGSC